MSSRSSRSTLDHDHHLRLPVSNITAFPVTEWTPRRRVRDVLSHNRSSLLGESPSVPRPQATLYPASPRPDLDAVHNRDHSGATSRLAREGNLNPTKLDNATSSKKAILEDRFEKMLALLDIDDSDSDSVDRRNHVKVDGDGVLASNDAGHGRVPPRQLRTPSPAQTNIQNDGIRSPSSTQHTTSFEQLRKIVTAISPNSTPRRRRTARVTQQYSGTARRAEQDEEDGDGTLGERDESFATVESDSASRPPNARDGLSRPDNTTGRRPNGSDLAQRPWKNRTFHADDLSLSSVPSDASVGNRVEYVRPRRPRDQSGGLARHIIPSRGDVTIRRPESRSTSTSTSESQDDRRDLFDTAPPSDLDVRFPALSPEPSPLNLRRRGMMENVGDVFESEDSEVDEIDEIAAELPDGNSNTGQGVSPMAEVGMPDFDLRWRQTEHFVDSYLTNRQHQLPGELAEMHGRGPISVNGTPRVSQTYAYHTTNEIVHGSGPGEAVMDRLEAVTEEVQALREQVAELSNLLSRGLDTRAPGLSTRPLDGEQSAGEDEGEMQNARWTKERNRVEHESPVSSFLMQMDSLVHGREETRNTSSDSPLQVPDRATMARICDPSNLDVLRRRIEGWKRMSR